MSAFIHKQALAIQDRTEILVPRGSQILKVAMQDGRLTVWYRFNDRMDDRRDRMLFRIVGTGHPHDASSGTYIDSVFDGPFVWHVFHSGSVPA